jgi:hypothetical protein
VTSIFPLERLPAVGNRKSWVTWWEFDPISHMIIPWQEAQFSEAILSTAHAQTSVDLAVIACALERRRRAQGSYPERLELLAPEFIKALPQDPCSGEAFRYRPLRNDRFVLYSVGWNQTDDNGETSGGKRGAEMELRKGDWIWNYLE